MANVSFTGRVGKEPELRFTNGQDAKAVLGFSVAESHRKFNKQTNEWEDTGTTWRNVSLWGGKAERMAEVLHKGDLVVVAGREQTREYQTKDGNPGSSLDVQADEVGLVSRPGATGGQQKSQGGQDGYNSQNFGSGRPNPNQQADPWSKQGGGNYDWGTEQTETPF